MPSDYRARVYRLIFAAAAAYNLGFGAWTILWPNAFFQLFEMAPPIYPSIWQCLGMVIGLYGLLYAYAARNLERAHPIIVIGLLGKIFGPIGWVFMVISGEWSLRTFPLIVFNDLVWWLPFALFLFDRARMHAAAPYVCALANALAAVALLALRGGTELAPSLDARVEFIAQHPILWRGGWAAWMIAALSLLWFYAWWGARCSSRRWGVAAFVIAVVGICCDWLAESLYIGWLPRDIERVAPLATLLTGAAANGLYTVAGIILTLRSPRLRGWFRVWTWAVWATGIGLTASTLAGSVTGMVVSTAAMMPLFCPWAVVMGRKLK